jgi:hypothetical protein
VAVVKLCAEVGCPRYRLPGHWTKRCELHAKAYSRAKDARRSSANPAYRRLLGSREYQTAKELVRRRDKTCRLADGSCSGRLEVHHVQPIEKGGAVADPANLILVCVRHHRVLEHRAKKKAMGGVPVRDRRKTHAGSSPRKKLASEAEKPNREELREAEQRVKEAEKRLQVAKGARAALEERPKRPERHLTTTWDSFEAYRRDRPHLL